jgi:cell wall-associated NlpC family hydrolase
MVRYVGEVLGRAHLLFGDPPDSAGPAAATAGTDLGWAGDLVRGARQRAAPMSGDLAGTYSGFTGAAAPALDTVAGLDEQVGGALTDAAAADRDGRSQSGAVFDGASADTAAMAPWTGTPAGQKALLTRLRRRLAQQQQVIVAYRARDAQLAAALRSMAYRSRMGGAGMGFAPAGFGSAGQGRAGGGAGSVSGLPGPPGLSGLTAAARDRNRQRIRVAAGRDPRGVPAGPGGVAVAAALTRQGAPYVFGAKGPNRFDCSGLTQWAWRNAGVLLGDDTYTQIHQGVPVPSGQVRAGDLIFPKDSFGEDGKPGPGHVQLAISATEIIHAPHTGDVVRVAPMPASYVAIRPVPSQ